MIRLLTTVCALSLWLQPATAQPLFANPLADAAAYRGAREEIPNATFRVRYEVTTTRSGNGTVVRELIIDVAPDWSLTREGASVILRDFRLNRSFTLETDRFTTRNSLAELSFRVMERQNRTYLQRLLAGTRVPPTDDCDAESELGLAIPGAQGASITEIRERSGYFSLRCADRDIGGFVPGGGVTPPAAFWPTMFSALTTHQALHRRIREDGHAPAKLDASYRLPTDVMMRRAWRLIDVEAVAVAYPLVDTLRNTTSDSLERLAVPGAARIATDAVAGRAQGGAPTAQSWGEHLLALSRSEGTAAAAMLILPTFNMFPGLEGSCGGVRPHPVCALAQRLGSIARDDPAPLSLVEIATAEQTGNPVAAIAAMQRAQASPQRDHPALGASFALAMVKFDRNALDQARAANLPTDLPALQARALMIFPYNPAYWTDIGDRLGLAYEWHDAFLFYDIAFSLPMPGAIVGNPALIAKRTSMERLRKDFPDASLPR